MMHKKLVHLANLVIFVLLLSALGACSKDTVAATQPQPETAELAKLEISSPNADELIFSSVKGTSSDAQHIILKNIGNAPLALSGLALAGPDAGAFALAAPALPGELAPGATLDAAITFVPGSAGSKHAQIQIVSSAVQATGIGLYGLGSEGEQGENEPPLQQIVDTLGYSVDVGASSLSLGSSDQTVGDEVRAPLFEKVDSGPVTLEVVARYSPVADLPYGFFNLDAAQPVTHQVGLITATETQKLLPARASGKATFDPGDVPFGVYGEAGGKLQYSLDGLNSGSITHALRVYPLKDRGGNAVANSFLIGLEEAENGDYQDALFVISNVKIASTTLSGAQRSY